MVRARASMPVAGAAVCIALCWLSVSPAAHGDALDNGPSQAQAPPPPAPVTDAIGATFDRPTLSHVNLEVTNSSAMTAACHYDATAKSLDPFVPKDTQRDFQVPPHTTSSNPHVETFSGASTPITYSITITCTDASGSQEEPLGAVQLSQTW